MRWHPVHRKRPHEEQKRELDKNVVVLQLPALAPVDMIGLTYGLVEHLWDLDVETLPEIGTIAGLPAHLAHMR